MSETTPELVTVEALLLQPIDETKQVELLAGVVYTSLRPRPRHATAPDVAGWRKERVPDFPEPLPIDIVPDWACEILSPSTARRDRTVKMELYAQHGVGHLWVVDPILRTVEAFRNDNGRWLRLGAWTDGDYAEISPFEAVNLDVGRLFPPKDGPLFAADEADAPYRPDGAYAGG